MNGKTKSNSVLTYTADPETGTITFRVLGISEPIVFESARASEACERRATLHGWIQRLADKAAISRDPATGKPVTPATKHAAVKALAEHYMTGTEEWSPNRSAAPRAIPAGSIVVRALAALQGMSVAEAEKRARSLAEKKRITTKAYLLQLRKAPAVARKVAELLAADALQAAASGGGAEGFEEDWAAAGGAGADDELKGEEALESGDEDTESDRARQ